ncbi:hypothetical protein L7F22_012884 [Adiantum nelumboides]|nr:hypothetical protein [Adiantum nelumboides]
MHEKEETIWLLKTLVDKNATDSIWYMFNVCACAGVCGHKVSILDELLQFNQSFSEPPFCYWGINNIGAAHGDYAKHHSPKPLPLKKQTQFLKTLDLHMLKSKTSGPEEANATPQNLRPAHAASRYGDSHKKMHGDLRLGQHELGLFTGQNKSIPYSLKPSLQQGGNQGLSQDLLLHIDCMA